jgi:hypothetical protein
MTPPPIFISAQPDETYFHWQVEIYLYQFAKHGIQDRCYALFGHRGSAPSSAALEIARKFKNVKFYRDDRNRAGPHYYIPTIRPHLLKKFFAEHPHLGASVFYHDSDIFLVRLPRFELMLADNNDYVSDTISYIGYNYIQSCQTRYNAKHAAAAADPLLPRMCAIAGLSVETVRQNQAYSGGCQYLLKGVDAAFWEEAETLCQRLYSCMKEYDAKYPIDHPIQSWATDMWVVLWLRWKGGATVRIHPELDFSWATHTVTEYNQKPIFHLAGITRDNRKGRLFKGEYNHKNLLTEYARNRSLFDDISANSATYAYVAVVREYVDSPTRFRLDSTDAWAAEYIMDASTNLFGRAVWRSADGAHLIFHSGTAWIITHSRYEKELTQASGGLASTKAPEPYEGGWNFPCTCRR